MVFGDQFERKFVVGVCVGPETREQDHGAPCASEIEHLQLHIVIHRHEPHFVRARIQRPGGAVIGTLQHQSQGRSLSPGPCDGSSIGTDGAFILAAQGIHREAQVRTIELDRVDGKRGQALIDAIQRSRQGSIRGLADLEHNAQLLSGGERPLPRADDILLRGRRSYCRTTGNEHERGNHRNNRCTHLQIPPTTRATPAIGNFMKAALIAL